MGTSKRDPRQMTGREARLEEFKRTHRYMDLEILGELERSMMLRMLVFLVKGPRTTGEIVRDGEFCSSSMVYKKLRRLRELGLIRTERHKRTTVVSLTDDGRAFAIGLQAVLDFLRKQRR